MCIAPILPAKVIKNVKITLGCLNDNFPFKDSITTIQKLGVTHVETDNPNVCEDKENRIYSTPCYMKDTKNYYEIF